MSETAAKTPSRARRILKRVGLVLGVVVVVLGALVAFGVYRPIARRAGLVVAAAQAPEFSLPDQTGATTSLTALTTKGPAVIVFYRGFW